MISLYFILAIPISHKAAEIIANLADQFVEDSL